MTIYALDPTGKNPANAIIGETHALSLSGAKYLLVIPSGGPFFASSMNVSIYGKRSTDVLNANFLLTKWVDYIPVLPFIEAINVFGQPIYAAILILDSGLVGTATLNYQSLGGAYQINQAAAAAYVTNTLDPATSDYASAFGITPNFGAATAVVDAVVKRTATNLKTAISSYSTIVSQQQRVSSALNFDAHIADFNNPHKDTALTFGLDKVPNWLTGNSADASIGQARNLFVTPAAAAAAISFSTTLPLATTTTPGTVLLNNGSSNGDSANATKALTASGLAVMRLDPTTAFANLNQKRKQLFFTPKPMVYPFIFNGTTCYNFRDLLNRAASFLNLNYVQGSATLGCIWVPYNTNTSTINMNNPG